MSDEEILKIFDDCIKAIEGSHFYGFTDISDPFRDKLVKLLKQKEVDKQENPFYKNMPGSGHGV